MTRDVTWFVGLRVARVERPRGRGEHGTVWADSRNTHTRQSTLFLLPTLCMYYCAAVHTYVVQSNSKSFVPETGAGSRREFKSAGQQ